MRVVVTGRNPNNNVRKITNNASTTTNSFPTYNYPLITVTSYLNHSIDSGSLSSFAPTALASLWASENMNFTTASASANSQPNNLENFLIPLKQPLIVYTQTLSSNRPRT